LCKQRVDEKPDFFEKSGFFWEINMTLVMKFGGTSVGDAAAIRRTAGLIARSHEAVGPTAVVVSAMSKVTDLLLRGAAGATAGDEAAFRQAAADLREKHGTAVADLLPPSAERDALMAELNRFIDRFEALCQAMLILGEATPRALDTVSGMGEQMSARLVAAYLRHQGYPAQALDATELIVTDDNFQAAAPLLPETTARCQQNLRPLLENGLIPIITGFIGATADGVTTTLGRGGSDYSAAILGQALAADEVWIWTDVDGVMTADPRLVPTARTISQLSYREVAELAYYGAKVLHPKTIRPVVENGVPLRIKNSFNPEHPGTLIVENYEAANGAIKGVTAVANLALITVEGKGMMGVPGIAARAFGAVAETRVSVLLITQASSEQSICFAVPDAAAERVVASLERAFAAELAQRDIDRIWAQRDVAIVTIVGAGMRGTPGIAGQIFTALGQRQVNVIAIAQGSSECSISLVVEGRDGGTAVKRIHDLI
jgi:bifunctional aspartokinase / homoserine dehydrogenase 1